MSADEYLEPDQIEAARTIVAALTVDLTDDAAGQEVTAMLAGLVDRHPAMPVEGALVVIKALLDMIEEELDVAPKETLRRLARFLAS